MVKIDVFSGFLGAGKTTFIKKLINDAYKGEKLVLIENEFGEIGIDGGFLKDAGIEINEMSQGCICCSLVGDFKEALRKVVDEMNPDRILIEPSGVGKLSDVVAAVQGIEGTEVDHLVTVVDAKKCRVYMKNFGEFFNNQVECANTIVLSRTQDMTEQKIHETVEMLTEKNAEARLLTTPWDLLDTQTIMSALNASKKSIEEELEMYHEHHHHHHHDKDDECGCEHEHHHHHHHDKDDECGCEHEHHHHHHHDKDDECGCEHEHHHHHHNKDDECECEHEHHHHHHDEECECECEHEHHHHHHHDEECECGCEHEHHHHEGEHYHVHGLDCPHCAKRLEKQINAIEGVKYCRIDFEDDFMVLDVENDEVMAKVKAVCADFEDGVTFHGHGEPCSDHHHGHHHADEVFTTWGTQTSHVFTKEELTSILEELNKEEYGQVLRAKGIVAGKDTWFYFDMVPEEIEIREGKADYTGRLCVIGSKIDEKKIQALFLGE